MKLYEYIENKSKELVSNKTYKSVTFHDVDTCQVSSNVTSKIYDFTETPKINPDVNIEEFDRSILHEKIDALEVVFNVVKPRCRKPERLRLYVRVVEAKIKCTGCGQICFNDESYPQVVFQDETHCICEECSIDFEEVGDKIQFRADLLGEGFIEPKATIN